MIYIFCLFLLGAIPALIAQKKGYTTIVWWFYGMMLFPIALIHILLVSPINVKKCPQCAEQVQKEALVCRHCSYKFDEKSDEAAQENARLEKPQNPVIF